jgi:hypothetical protein
MYVHDLCNTNNDNRSSKIRLVNEIITICSSLSLVLNVMQVHFIKIERNA